MSALPRIFIDKNIVTEPVAKVVPMLETPTVCELYNDNHDFIGLYHSETRLTQKASDIKKHTPFLQPTDTVKPA